MDALEYWQRQAQELTQEYELVIQEQRNEIETLQRKCSELMYENQMMKAATAADIRNFILNYQANVAKMKTNSNSTTSVTENIEMKHRSNLNSDNIPITLLLQYLHNYSNGLVGGPENKRKRRRPSTSGSSTSSLTQLQRPQNINTNINNYANSSTNSGSNNGSPPNSPFSTFQNRRLYQRMLTRCFRHRTRESDLELLSSPESESEWELQRALCHTQSHSNNNNNNNKGKNVEEHSNSERTRKIEHLRNTSIPQYHQHFSISANNKVISNDNAHQATLPLEHQQYNEFEGNNNNNLLACNLNGHDVAKQKQQGNNAFSLEYNNNQYNNNKNNNSKDISKMWSINKNASVNNTSPEVKVSLFKPFQP